MKQDRAQAAADEILAVCEKHGLWVTKSEDRKPGLSAIRLEVSIKITSRGDGKP